MKTEQTKESTVKGFSDSRCLHTVHVLLVPIMKKLTMSTSHNTFPILVSFCLKSLMFQNSITILILYRFVSKIATYLLLAVSGW